MNETLGNERVSQLQNWRRDLYPEKQVVTVEQAAPGEVHMLNASRKNVSNLGWVLPRNPGTPMTKDETAIY